MHSRAVLTQLSATDQIADGVLQCALPPANRSGALGVLSYDFSSPLAVAGRPSATRRSAATVTSRAPRRHIRAAARRPTTTPRPRRRSASGSALFTTAISASRVAAGAPAAALCHNAERPPRPAPLEFNISFDLLIGRHQLREYAPRGDGSFTFNLGALDENSTIGLTGAALGLSVQFFFLLGAARR